MDILGLPLDSALALLLMVLLPVISYLLYRRDQRGSAGPSSRTPSSNNA